jgi:hypothetical protein
VAEDSLAFDSNGNPAKELKNDKYDYDFVASTTNRRGEDISGNTTLSFINFPEKVKDEQTVVSRFEDILFDPRAKIILIDGEVKFGEDSRRVYNRPYNTIEPSSQFYSKNQSELIQSSLVTGNLVNYMHNVNSGKIVFYYYESRENRWVISSQQLDRSSNVKIDSNSRQLHGRTVFRWIEDRVMTKLY